MSIIQIPAAVEMEKALIVAILSDPSLVIKATKILNDDDFFLEDHKEIYRTIKSVEIQSLDSLTVQDKLSDKTKDYFIDLVKNSESLIPSLTNALVYIRTIKDKSKLRAGIDLGREITALCYDATNPTEDTLQKVESIFANFLHERMQNSPQIDTKKAFEEFLKDLPYKREEVGIKTGFYTVDEVLGSMEGLVILGARPSVGKSQFSFQIARNVAESRPVLLFSLEQPRSQIFQRLLAAESEVRLTEIRDGSYVSNQDSVERIDKAAQILRKTFENIYVDDMAGVSADYITSMSRQQALQRGDVGLIVIDYLNLMRLDDIPKVQGLEKACTDLRNLGKELRCPVLLLSQLSRQPDRYNDSDGNKRHRRPELTDLRDSGGIEQVADQVLMLYKETEQDEVSSPAEDIVEVLIRKNRNGAIGGSSLRWIPRFVKLYDM